MPIAQKQAEKFMREQLAPASETISTPKLTQSQREQILAAAEKSLVKIQAAKTIAALA